LYQHKLSLSLNKTDLKCRSLFSYMFAKKFISFKKVWTDEPPRPAGFFPVPSRFKRFFPVRLLLGFAA
jgi:hypothetical protein